MQGIELIPNQPIIFEDAVDACNRSLAQCYCQKYQPGDYLKLQFKQVPCGVDLICDGSFADDTQTEGEVIDNACWLGEGNAGYYGWLVSSPGQACHIPGAAGETLDAVSPPFTTTKYYKLQFIISGTTAGVLTVDAGGVVFSYSTDGLKTIYFTATATNLTFEADIDFDGCISEVEAWEISNNIDVIINDLDGNPIANLDDFKTYNNEYITIVALIDDIVQQSGGDPLEYGKYTVMITDPCNENEFISNCIDYREEHECTKLIEGTCGCLAYGFDFSHDFTLVQRISALKFNSRYPAKQENFTYSNGNYRRVYTERNKVVTFKTDYIDEPAHDCLSLQLLCDLLTIDGTAYFYKENEYKPRWDVDGAYNLAVVQVELETQNKAVIYNTNCGTCDSDVVYRHRCCLHGWGVTASYKEIHDIEEWLDNSTSIEFVLHYAIINGVDVLGFSPTFTITRDSLGAYTPAIVVDDVHNDNEGVGYGTVPNTIAQNVTDWVNSQIDSAILKFIDNMSAVEKSKTMTFEVLISKHFTGMLSDEQDRYLYTQDGLLAEADYTNIDDAWPDPLIPYLTCVDI